MLISTLRCSSDVLPQLWSTYPDRDVVNAAKTKLICDDGALYELAGKSLEWHETLKTQIFALHSARLLLKLTDSPAAIKIASAAVKSHMRIATHYDASNGIVTTEAPSEPMLAIAAGALLLENKKHYVNAMYDLVQRLIWGEQIVSSGEHGELLARSTIMVTRDATLCESGGQLCRPEELGVELSPTDPSYPDRKLNLVVRPFTACSWLDRLLETKEIPDSHLDTWRDLKSWASDVRMNFTHFVQLENHIESSLSSDFLKMCWLRGWALQCVHNQAVINIILIGYRGDLSKELDPKQFVFIVVQVKKRVEAAPLNLITAMTCPHIHLPGEPSQRWKPEFVAILMDMGTMDTFQEGKDHFVNLSFTPTEGGTCSGLHTMALLTPRKRFASTFVVWTPIALCPNGLLRLSHLGRTLRPRLPNGRSY